MDLNHDFTVPVPVADAWRILTDVERIAPCLPGAELQEVEGDTYRGVVKVKVGPIQAQFKGQASFVERDDVNLQASGANAGSLHVQLLAFDFTGQPDAGPNRAADTLPLGPASIALWRQIERDTGKDLEIKVTGGLMLAETARDLEVLKAKVALEKSRGIEAEVIGANELRALEPSIGDVAIGAVHWNRYFESFASCPMGLSGHGSARWTYSSPVSPHTGAALGSSENA